MQSIVEQHLSEIQELCRRFGVRKLELFGSAARADFDPDQSDVDFFVEFSDRNWQGSFKRFIGLKLELESLFGRAVDLVEEEAVKNPLFLQVANEHRRLLYAA